MTDHPNGSPEIVINHATVRERWGMADFIAGCAARGLARASVWGDEIDRIGTASALTLMDDNGIAAFGFNRAGPLLTGGDYTPHEEIFTERNYHEGDDPIRSVRTKRFHYLRNFDKQAKRKWLPHEILAMPSPKRDGWPSPALPRDEEELFDVQKDPQEFVNLAANPEYAAIKQELAAKVADWMKTTDDPLLDGPIPDMMNPWPEKYKKKGGH